jgi:hypothetical protein
MLYTITTPDDGLITVIKDDPVRPEIPASDRVNHNSRIYVWMNGNETAAVTCVKFLESVPAAVEDMADMVGGATTAVFYTIWSYVPGAGRNLIFDAVKHIKETKPEIKRFVTLSPKTEMAKNFHHKNGAITFRENLESVNYEYC